MIGRAFPGPGLQPCGPLLVSAVGAWMRNTGQVGRVSVTDGSRPEPGSGVVRADEGRECLPPPGMGDGRVPAPATPRVYSYALPDPERGGGVGAVYRSDALTGLWHWSEGMYGIYGFVPHEVVPTTRLFLAHVHPDDLAYVDGLLEEALTGVPVLLHYRITDARGRSRILVMTARPWRKVHGAVGGLKGLVWDMTAVRAEEIRAAAQEAVEPSMVHRAQIEEAKGTLLLHYHVGPAKAFGVLAHLSRQTNRKLWLVAAGLIAAVDGDGCRHNDGSSGAGSERLATVTDIRVQLGVPGTALAGNGRNGDGCDG